MTNATELISITTEARPNSQLAATIEVTADRSQQVYNQVLNDLVRNTQLPGFRKGKAPKQLLLKQIGAQRLRYAAMEKLIEDTVKEAVKQQNIPYLGNLKLEGDVAEVLEQFDPQQPFRFSVTFDVTPEVSVSSYQGLTIEYSPVTYDPATVDEVLQRHQREHATLIPVEDRPAQWGDDVTIKLETKDAKTGEIIDTLSAAELPLTLDEQQPFVLREIPAAVVGMAIAETKTVTVTLPQETEGAAEEPTTAIAEIELLEIKAPELPPLDDAFATEHSEFSTMAELRSHLETTYQERAQKEDKTAKENALIDALIAANEVPVPATLVDREAEHEVKESLYRLQSQGLDLSKVLTRDLYDKMLAEVKPAAARNVKANLLLRAIAKAEGIVPTEEAIAERVKEYMAALGNTSPKQREALRDIASTELTKSQTLAWLLEHNQFQPLAAPTPPEPDAEHATAEAAEPAPAKAKKRSGKKATPPLGIE
ncbi:trigger factor [Parathermosynechococcus lividus]